MTNSVFKTYTNPGARTQRNGFDRSYRNNFTMPVGALLPCFCQDVVPGEKCRISNTTFIRTLPLNTAAFSRLTQHVDYFYIPYKYLWHYFGDMMTGVLDLHSSAAVLSAGSVDGDMITPTKVPFFKCLNSSLFDELNNTSDIFGYNNLKNANRLLDLLDYGHVIEPTPESGTSSTDYNNPFRLLAYQKIYYDFYRNKQYEANKLAAYNIDNYTPAYINNGGPLIGGVAQLRAMFELHYRPFKKDYFTSVLPSASFNGAVGSSIDSFKLPLNSEGLGNLPSDSNSGVITSDTHLTSGGHNFGVPNYFYSGAIGKFYSQIFQDSTTKNVSEVVSYLSVPTIRNMIALDKLVNITRASSPDYSSLMQNRYGVRPHDSAHVARYIGSNSQPIQIGEVVSTSETATQSLGTIAGRGTSVGKSGDFNFTADDFGIVMGIISIIPEACYDAPCSPFNLKSSMPDYFVPEYEDLGLQAVSFFGPTSQNSLFSQDLFGWQPRYMEYKTSYDKVHGEFKQNGSLKSWCTPRVPETPTNYKRLAINPSITNPICAVNYDGSEKTDLFLVDQYNSSYSVSPMSVSSFPNL